MNNYQVLAKKTKTSVDRPCRVADDHGLLLIWVSSAHQVALRGQTAMDTRIIQ